MTEKDSVNQLYSSKTLFTLSGASSGVWLLTNVISNVFDVDLSYVKWIGLTMSLFLAFLGAINLNKKLNLNLGTVAFFNGLLIFVTASGIDSINHGLGEKKEKKEVKESALIPFLSENIWWFPQNVKDSLTELSDSIDVVNEQVESEKKKVDSLENELVLIFLYKEKYDSLFVEHQVLLSEVSTSKKDVATHQLKKGPKLIEKESVKASINKPYKKYKAFKEEGLYGLLKDQDTILSPQYDIINLIEYRGKTYFSVSKNNKWGVLNEEMDLIIKCKQRKEKYAFNALKLYVSYNSGNIRKIGM